MDEHRKTIMMVDSRPVQREKVKEILEGTYEIKEAERRTPSCSSHGQVLWMPYFWAA